MIFIVDKKNKIINVLNGNDLNTPNSKPFYPWLWLGDTWNKTMPLDYAKEEKKKKTGKKFAYERDKVRYVVLNGQSYGFDCAPVDIANFMANMKRAELLGTSEHKVFHEGVKQVVQFSYLNFKTILLNVSEDQLKWYDWYKKKVAEIEACKTIEEVEHVSLNGSEPGIDRDENPSSKS